MESNSNQRHRALRRYAPLVAIIGGLAVVGVVIAVTSGDDGGETATTVAATTAVSGSATAGPEASGGAASSAPSRPAGAISYSQAQAEGLDVTFGDGCDEETGRIALPYFFAPECFAQSDDNGGATATGVTADSIKVVLYLAPDDDPILNFITAPLNIDDTNADVEATYRGYAEMFQQHYELYGRHVEIEVYNGTGLSNDEVAARADAVAIAAQQPFAVWGGPALTTAFADELAARGVICLGCLTSGAPGWTAERAPYLWPIVMSGDQNRQIFTEYLSKQVAGRPAQHAGDPALQGQLRQFALLYIETSPDSTRGAQDLADRLAAAGIDLVEVIPYTLDPARLQEQADATIARLKASGTTSVIFTGDPIAPATFTRAATAQRFFPEWVLFGTALIDTTAFGRTYDQQQWSHAFGISQLTARDSLYEWFTGSPPPADDSAGVLFPQPSTFFAGVMQAGPDLTPETFREGLFRGEVEGSSLLNPIVSFGEHGLWPTPDYNGIDDVTEIWWDADATGPDEIRRDGTGMYAYVDGGTRYLLDQLPETDSKAFVDEGAVTLYQELPPNEAVPDYPSPAG
jgi:hypothetical protein